MAELTRDVFADMMGQLRAAYPTQRFAVSWPTVVRVYWDGLVHRHPPDALTVAFREAGHEHPGYFPTMGQIGTLAARHAQEQRKPQREPPPEQISDEERAANLREVRKLIESIH